MLSPTTSDQSFYITSEAGGISNLAAIKYRHIIWRITSHVKSFQTSSLATKPDTKASLTKNPHHNGDHQQVGLPINPFTLNLTRNVSESELDSKACFRQKQSILKKTKIILWNSQLRFQTFKTYYKSAVGQSKCLGARNWETDIFVSSLALSPPSSYQLHVNMRDWIQCDSEIPPIWSTLVRVCLVEWGSSSC